MGVASGGCQGHGETGAGAAAAVATGKRGRGEGWCHTRGWVVRKNRVKKKEIENMQKVAKNKEEGRKKMLGEAGVQIKSTRRAQQ